MKIGDRVEKIRGYRWPGEVRAVFTNKAGETRVVVECTVPEVAGALHIYSPDQLAPMRARPTVNTPLRESRLTKIGTARRRAAVD